MHNLPVALFKQMLLNLLEICLGSTDDVTPTMLTEPGTVSRLKVRV
jgi:hypothetical protein